MIGTPGSLSTEWKNAKFFALEDPSGDKMVTAENTIGVEKVVDELAVHAPE